MPLYMLDTDTVSYFLRGRTPTLDDRMATVSLKHLCISAVTWGELLYGVKRKEVAHRLAQLLDQFRLRVRCLAWDEATATQFASIAAQLHKARTRIGSMDAMIATHALATGAVLITNNSRHFSRVSGLRVENWCQPDH